MYNIHKKCFDCVVKMEAKLKIKGEYDDYEKDSIIKNASSYINHLESYLMDALNTSNNHEGSWIDNLASHDLCKKFQFVLVFF